MKPNCEAFDEVTVSAPPMPRHVGIIMDGNGRWAQERGRSRLIGHRMGVIAVRRTVREAARLGIEQLTLFTFSTENWRRPAVEVRFLWRLIRRFLRAECKELRDNGIRLRAIGRLDGLPEEVRSELRQAIATTRGGDALTLCLAVNYGGRAEVVDACRHLVRRAVAGHISADEIKEETLGACLYQPDMPPLDLIIRTGGEMRLSNFLLWQAAYAELWVTPVAWPDFGGEHLREAVSDFLRRKRRFGGLPQPDDEAAMRAAADMQSVLSIAF
ncbi:MAG: polyprenyl diphosphate synthase [Candidatus Brocadiia bacterium]